MAGPSLKLGISGTGRETIDALNVSLERLRGNLSSLKLVKPDLGSLDSLTSEFQKFRNQFTELAQGQKTALVELSEILKKGLSSAAGQVRSGSRAITDEIKTAEQQQAQAFASLARQMQKQAEDMSKASARVTNSLVKQAGKGEAGTQTLLYGKGAGAQAELAEMAAYYRGIEETHRAGVAKLEAEYAKSIASLDKLVAAEIRAATRQGYTPAGPAWWDQVIREEEAALLRLQRLDAAFQARGSKAQLGTAVQARAQLDQGISSEQVKQQYGGLAVAAAQSAESLKALKIAHDAASNSISDGIPKVRGMKQALDDAHGAVKGLASGFGQTLPMFASISTFLAGTALSSAFAKTVSVGAEVEHELAIVRVLGDETSASVAGLREQLFQLGAQGPFGPREVAEAFKTLTLAGLSVKEQKQAIGDVLNFAIAGTTTIQQAATSLVQIGTAFGYTANGFGRVGDVISKAAAVSLSSVESLTQSMQSASEVHTLYGQSLIDVATNLAVLSQLGIRGTAAGTALKNMYAELSGSTSIVRKNMLAWQIDVLNPQTGKVKELLPLIEELAQKYNKLKGPDQTRFVQDLSNTRGGKDLVALIDAYNKLGKDDQGVNRLVELRKQIEESYAFQAVSAAQLSLTAKNQIASTAAAFQTSLAKAFEGLQPAVLQISQRLKEVFGSNEFQANVQNLAVAVGNLGVFLVQHLEAIKNIALAWVAWKAAMGVQAVFAAVGTGLTTLAAGYKSLTAAKVADTAATEANAVAQAASSSRAVKGLAGYIPMIGGLLAGGILLWDLYWASASGKKNNAREDAYAANKALVENLKEQAERTRQQWAAMVDPNGQAEFNKQQAIGKNALDKFDTELDELAKRSDAARLKLEAANAKLDTARSLGGGRGNSGFLSLAQSEQAQAKAAYEAARADYTRTLQLKLDLGQALKDNQMYSEGLAKLADQSAAKVGPQGTGARPLLPEAAASASSSLKAEFQQREKTIKEQYAFEQKQLEEQAKNKLISEETYAAASKDVAERQYNAELALLQSYAAKAKPLYEEIRAAGKTNKASAGLTELEETLKRLDQELAQRKIIADLKSRGDSNLTGRKFDTELAKLREAVDLEERQAEAKLAYDRLLPEEQAYLTARNATAEKYFNLVTDAEQRIRDLQRDLLVAEITDSPVADQLRKRISELESELARIRKERDTQADRAGQNAARAVVPTWKKNLDEWANATRSMQRYWDEMVGGIIEKGRTVWDNFVKTGKLSFGSILEFVRDQLSKAMYEQLLAPYFASLGKKIADWTLGSRKGGEAGKPGATDAAGKAWEAATGRKGQRGEQDDWLEEFKQRASSAWDFVKDKAGSTWEWIKSAGTTLWDSITSIFKSDAVPAVNEFMRSLDSATGGLGDFTSSLVDSINSIFSNGGGFGGGGGGEGQFIEAAAAFFGFAKGGAFTPLGQISAYAKGDVFSSPTLFKFASGAGFSAGVMGEAGPEAVMPLKRGPNGSLGVANHGGSGRPVNVIINAPAGTTVERQESRDDGQTMEVWLAAAEKRAVSAVNKSIANGGSVATTLKAKGVNMTGGLPRRS